MSQPKVLALAGSARQGSYNKLLVGIAAESARQAGADVTLIDLRDFPMPIYDGDDEARTGLPPQALRFRSLLGSHQGFLIASPEHNGSVTALLKNALDWSSRPLGGEDGLALVRGKPAALLSASPGPFGGVRSVAHLRGILSKMGVNVLADEVLVAAAPTAFDGQGKLTNELSAKLTAQLAANLTTQIRRVSAS